MTASKESYSTTVDSRHGGGDVESNGVSIHPSQGIHERRLVTKIDLHVLPALGILYFMAYLDR